MTGIYIGSTGPWAGKSLISFSLGVILQKAGYSLGYMKPLGAYPQQYEERIGDSDALVIQEILGQNSPADTVTPIIIPTSLQALSLTDTFKDKPPALEKISEAYAQISLDKDFTLVSGSGSFTDTGTYCKADGLSIVKKLGLKMLLVDRFDRSFSYDSILKVHDFLGDALLGVVLNDVPEKHILDFEKLLKPFLESRGVRVLGIMPHEIGLEGIRASELAHSLGGFIAAGNKNASRMVKGYVIGAMQVDNFMTFLRQKASDAVVIVGGDRADLQIAALYGDTPCMILTGNHSPCELVRSKAEEKGVPVICVREDTFSVARSMSILTKSKKIRDLNHIKMGVAMVEEHFAFDDFMASLD